jgi:hypothetical protein
MTAPTPTSAAIARALEHRWERIGLGVRCAYNADAPEVLQRYVQAGRALSRLQPMQEMHVQRRMLELLLRTAADEALHWAWRAACLEHTAWPRARLARLIASSDGQADVGTAALDARIQQAWQRLGLPSSPAHPTSGAVIPEPHGRG